MIKPAKLLLIAPLGIVIGGLLLTSHHGPYYFGDNLDPDYVYLFNSLNLLTFHPPAHTDHPGTTLQLLGAVVVLIRWFLTGLVGKWLTLPEAVLGDPESYLLSINFALNLVVAGAAYAAAVRLYRVTGRIWAGVVFQLSIFPFLQTIVALTRVSPEPLLVAVGLAMAIPLATVAAGKASDAETAASARLAGILFGFGMVTKITFFPWLTAIFLYATRRDKARFLIGAGATMTILLVPIYPRLWSTGQWFTSLLTHRGQYGSGDAGFPTPATLLKNTVGQAHGEPWLFIFLALYAGLLFAEVIRPGAIGGSPIRRVLFFGSAAIALGVLMVAKHPAPHYIVPVLTVTALLNASIFSCYVLGASKVVGVSQTVAVAFGFILAGSASYGFCRALIWVAEQGAYVDSVKALLLKDNDLRPCEIIGMYRSSVPEFALTFGDSFAAAAQGGVLQELHPNLIAFNIYTGQFLSPTNADKLTYVKDRLRHNGCLILQGTKLTTTTGFGLAGLSLQEIGTGAKEVLYRLGLDPAASEPLSATPPFSPGTITHEAEDLSAGNVVVDKIFWGLGIGVITTPKSPAYAEYKIKINTAGMFNIYIRYAAAASRPITVAVDDKRLTTNACSEPTGGFSPKDQLWQKAGTAQLSSGDHIVRLESSGPFPHIDKLAFEPRP